MQIKRLKLTGFKSFVEPAELHILKGLTGIVGPNGCGKSNLLEAIRWVMGESSPKSMRGGGMEDVIFAGTSTRPARNFAEVALTAEQYVPDGKDGSAEDLEVIRRIERGAGSAYRANGRDVRAKDISLIFADAATGAHSPALVSQGKISAIIAAKPAERRQMLEEAAGISGLHVRRKDAEQKLRAAESNLSKLDLILSEMELRASNLKRQARQAEKYRKLSDQIKQAEAKLIFVRWKEAKSAADIAKAEAQAAAIAVEEAHAAHQKLSAQNDEAIKNLASQRAQSLAARDAVNDASQNLVKLQGEANLAAQKLNDLERQQLRLQDELTRDDKMTHDAAQNLDDSRSMLADLTDDLRAEEAARPAFEKALAKSEEDVRKYDLSHARALADQARVEADIRVADNRVTTLRTQMDRLYSAQQRALSAKAALPDIEILSQNIQIFETNAAQNEQQLQIINQQIEDIAQKRKIADEQYYEAQRQRSSEDSILAALQSENNALSKEMARQSHEGGIVQKITAQPGYETALASVMGDDLFAEMDEIADRRWSIFPHDANALGVDFNSIGADRLIHFVDAPSILHRRLAQIIVAEHDDGRILDQGQRLVTLSGIMRRWDGFITKGDGAIIARNLQQANRQKTLLKEIETAQKKVNLAEQSCSQMGDEIGKLSRMHGDISAQKNQCENLYRTALRDGDKARLEHERMSGNIKRLDEEIAGISTDIAPMQSEYEEAKKARNALPSADYIHQKLAEISVQLDNGRADLLARQAALSSQEQRIAQIKEKRAVTQANIRNWQDRAGEAETRIAAMKSQLADIEVERDILCERPAYLQRDIIAEQTKMEQRQEKLTLILEQENMLQIAVKSIEGDLHKAAEILSSAREARAGAQARAENQESRRIEMGRISGERFSCPPPLLPEKLEFDENLLRDAAHESATLEKLQSERERIGPVNLVAADELAALEDDQHRGRSEAEELTLAINQLRGSIGSLNREGRARLLAAFEAVNEHFRRLFTTLFNGGQAHLELIDDEDPLQAGLEIMAQPPGKKLTSLTLLSGGEQALTAVALIFGLFLTNPAPICVLDEVDAPLDDANIERFCDLLDAMTKETNTRYLIVTHNAVTMSRMHRLFGVTMIEQGVSRLVSVDLGQAENLLTSN
ncbi:chromosome segregation protein SMC [Sphingorhabdus lutea]|uniref:Chromosome partition protein Smc n=1 Tax=Sphingorhabdus lutea TaxID=1913578 RepID=A0A1L3JAW1_9SPHN|nr:chromosome segregation protein SMC [Sphingorhabdus lutea]APG62275.1 chromosome segregation protein SMC [Sphingorhabdus lutea]